MAPVLLRAPTRGTFLTAVSRPSTTTPTTLMVTSPRSPTLELLPTLRLSLLPTTPLPMPPLLSTLLPTPLPTTLSPTPSLLPTLLPLSMLDTDLLDTVLSDTALLDTALSDMVSLDTVLPTWDKQELPQQTFKK